jgi:hypothetical protein
MHPARATFNQYRPPEIKPGDPRKAKPWIRLVYKVYGQHAHRVILWFAHRAQRPEEKINYGLVFGGVPNIGKDTIIEGARQAVGEWNCREASPQDIFGTFNGYAKAVILRINETRDLGEQSQHTFHNKMKVYLAAPPFTLPVNEKFINQYEIANVCGVVLTTNHRETGLFLPPDDRRHFVLWSERQPEDFKPEDFQPQDFTPKAPNPTYWDWFWGWYENGGYEHVAAFLRQRNISRFNPKEPPPKTEAFWAVVNANRSAEESELEMVLAIMGRPAVVTLSRILEQKGLPPQLEEWLHNRNNRRV